MNGSYHVEQDGSGNILYVHSAKPARTEYKDFQDNLKYPTQKDFDGAFVEITRAEWMPELEEAKRCPLDKDGVPRYRLSGKVTIPNANVLNIDLSDPNLEITATGVVVA